MKSRVPCSSPFEHNRQLTPTRLRDRVHIFYHLFFLLASSTICLLLHVVIRVLVLITLTAAAADILAILAERASDSTGASTTIAQNRPVSTPPTNVMQRLLAQAASAEASAPVPAPAIAPRAKAEAYGKGYTNKTCLHLLYHFLFLSHEKVTAAFIFFLS